MSGLDVLLLVAGLLVTACVVVGMVLLTPRGAERGSRATPDVDPLPDPPRRRTTQSAAG